MPAGTRRARDFHDRRARWTVHADVWRARNFERDLLLSSDAYTRARGAQLHGLGGQCDYWGFGETDLLNTLDLILERLEEVGLYAAAHKCTFFEASITWCGKVYSQENSSTMLSR